MTGFYQDPGQRDYLDQVLKNWRLTPATFAHKISRGQWIAKPHLQYISARVARGIRKGGARIIISAPPRHGKSQLASIYMPAWVLECFAHYQVILATYGADLSVGFARQVRELFQDDANHSLLTTRIQRDASKLAGFLTDKGGSMYSVGMGGPITGRGANVLLIDDYIKEIKEALSPAYRDYIWNWFTTTAYTRLEPGGSCVIVATRWHSDDLIGRILKNFPDQWEYIEIPAIAEAGDILGRELGEPLFPERYPIERLNELQNTLGSIFFQALFQQKPVDESKKLASGDWLKVVDIAPLRNLKVARVWDLAATQGGGDYTVGSLVGYSEETNYTYVLNVMRRQLGPSQVEELVKNTALSDGLDTPVWIEQEPGSAGLSLINHYQKNVLPEFQVEGVPTTKAKVVRAQPFLAAAEAGRVLLLAGAWNQAFISEFDTFPGAFDDQVDTVAAGYVKLSGRKVFTASWGRKNKSANGAGTANSKVTTRAMFNAGARNRATFGRRS